jgi:hypothetical protein
MPPALGPEAEGSGAAMFGPTYLAAPTICGDSTIYGRGFLCNLRRSRLPQLPKFLRGKPFRMPLQVVRNWHWPCLVVGYARHWHDQDAIDISSEPRAHHLEVSHGDSLGPHHRAGDRQDRRSRVRCQHLGPDGQAGPRLCLASASQAVGRALHAWVIPEQASIPEAYKVFDETSTLTDRDSEKRVKEVGRLVARFAYLHTSEKAQEFLKA